MTPQVSEFENSKKNIKTLTSSSVSNHVKIQILQNAIKMFSCFFLTLLNAQLGHEFHENCFGL